MKRIERVRERIRINKLVKEFKYNINWVVSKEKGNIVVRNWR